MSIFVVLMAGSARSHPAEDYGFYTFMQALSADHYTVARGGIK